MKTVVRRGWPVLGICAVAGFATMMTAAERKTAADKPVDSNLVERGRYVAKVSNCNDCHTAGYTIRQGDVSEGEWLQGNPVGWRGPWGTTYAPNLRIYMAAMSEDEWVRVARVLRTRPPMPWFNLKAMKEEDLRALYQLVRSLGPVGEPMPSALPPGEVPEGPFVQFPGPPPSE